MNSLYRSWSTLLTEHKSLLDELQSSVQSEKKAILSAEYELIRSSTITKEKATRKLAVMQERIQALKEKSCELFGLSDESIGLDEIFNQFSPNETKQLQKTRSELLRQSRAIDKVNAFNARCLKTYVRYIDNVQTIFSNGQPGRYQVYSSHGTKTYGDTSGRLVRRSL